MVPALGGLARAWAREEGGAERLMRSDAGAQPGRSRRADMRAEGILRRGVCAVCGGEHAASTRRWGAGGERQERSYRAAWRWMATKPWTLGAISNAFPLYDCKAVRKSVKVSV